MNKIQEITLPTPDYEELILPSNGIGHGIRKLFVRPMTMKEEKILTNRTFAKNGKAHDEIFKACIGYGEDVNGERIEKSSINIDDLYIEDEYALFIFLRIISYGFDYDVEIECPACGTKQETTINLEQIPVKYANEDTPLFVTKELPKSKTVVKIGYPTKRDANQSGGNTYDMLPLLVREAQGIPKEVLNEWVQRLVGLDVSVIRKSVQDTPFGLSKEVPFTCKNQSCQKVGEVQEVDLPITAEFFRI